MTDLAPFDPSTVAVVIVDAQPNVLCRVAGSETAIELLGPVTAGARAAGARVAFVRVFLTAEDAAAVPPTNKMFGHFASMTPPADGPESQIDARLDVAADDLVCTKTRMGSFSTTSLNADLRSLGIDTIVLAGVATSGAVLTTAREAADLDYRVVVLSDCCVDFDAEVHRILTEKVLPMTSDVVESPEFLVALDTAINPESTAP